MQYYWSDSIRFEQHDEKYYFKLTFMLTNIQACGTKRKFVQPW